jgi:hypothetical protein
VPRELLVNCGTGNGKRRWIAREISTAQPGPLGATLELPISNAFDAFAFARTRRVPERSTGAPLKNATVARTPYGSISLERDSGIGMNHVINVWASDSNALDRRRRTCRRLGGRTWAVASSICFESDIRRFETSTVVTQET